MRAAALVLLLAVASCSSPEPVATEPGTSRHPSPSRSVTSAAPAEETRPPEPAPTPAPRPPDPRWQFFTDDRTRWRSPWFAGRHRVMIPFGCTPAPFYDPDPTCPGDRGRHHGIDVAIPCGVALRAGRAATVHAALGPAYGVNPVLLRVGRQDVVIGHTVRVFVSPGDQVRAGEVFARVGDSAAPDGCHLHFEVRPAGGDYTSAVDPRPLLRLEG